MKIVVFGMGYVGFTAACCMASEGHDVIGIDVSARKVHDINEGIPPITESGLQKMLSDGLAAGRIQAGTVIGNHLQGADLVMVCVGTPSAPDGSHNMGYIADVSRQIAQALPEQDPMPSVVYRSTIRPGTTDDLIRPIFVAALGLETAQKLRLVYNPEFLREGSAVEDYFQPPKIVMGTVDGHPDPVLENLNQNITAPVFCVRYREAEIIKFVDNTWHAIKVSFANEVGRACLNMGISARQVHEIFISDTKLNISPYYLRPGGAFGGSCLPKDVRALQFIGADIGANLHLVDSLIRSNEAHKHRLFEYATEGLNPGALILLIGLAFKADTDDLRESPNVDLVRKLLSAGYKVEVFDPAIRAEMLVGANLGYAYSHLPMLESLLVDKVRAEATCYSRVIACNATVRALSLSPDVDLRNIDVLP